MIVLAVVGVVYYVANPNLPHYQAPSEVRYLPQWKDEARQRLLHAPGHPGERPALRLVHRPRTALLRRTLRRPEYLARFGFLVDPQQKASDLNPGNLPVGFSQHRDEKTGTRYLDITCAACHTGELRYQGKSLRIDGGAAMHSIAATVPTLRGGAFGQALGASMAATYNPFKFNRFARKVLGERYGWTSRNCAPTSRPSSTPSCAPPGTTPAATSTPPRKAPAAPTPSGASPTASSAMPSTRATTASPTPR